MDKVIAGFQCSQDMDDALRQLAHQKMMSKSKLIRIALQKVYGQELYSLTEGRAG